MDYRDITNLLLKIAGAVIVAYAIIEVPAYVSYYFSLRDGSLGAFVGMTIIPMLIPLILGFGLLLFPETVTNKLLKGGEISTESSIDLEAVERIAFSVLGLYLLFRVVSDLFYHGTSMFALSRHVEDVIEAYANPYALLVAAVAELVFALYLLFGAGGLVRLLAKLRTVGRD
jgi:hypothetical protein